MDEKRYLGASSTGIIHICFGPNAATCNSRSTGLRNRPVSRKHAEDAPDKYFCKKCFWSGRPSAEYLDLFYEKVTA